MNISNYTAHFSSNIEEEWRPLNPICLGNVPSGLGTPDAYVLVKRGEEKFLRIDLYDTPSPFEEASFFEEWIVIGFGSSIHFLMPGTNIIQSYALDSYFGHLYALDGYLLVASGTSLSRFDENAHRVWHAKYLGIDGVIVLAIRDEVIFGEGDWDPASKNWVPFKLSLHTGKKI